MTNLSKKGTILTGVALLALGIWWFVTKDSSEPKVIKIESSTNVKAEKINLVVEEKPSLKMEPPSILEESPLDICAKVARQKGEMEARAEQFLTDFHLSPADIAASGAYTTLDLASLKSLADANDSSAMLVYGTALYWHAVVGVDLYEIGLNSEKLSTEQAKAHKVEDAKVAVANSYLYRSALYGRSGALMELQALQGLEIRKLIKHKASDEKIKDKILNNLATSRLLIAVHKNNSFLNTYFNEGFIAQGVKTQIADWLQTKNKEVIDEEYKHLKLSSEKLSHKLEQTWIADRDYLGLEPFPKLLDDELNEYLTNQQTCELNQ